MTTEEKDRLIHQLFVGMIVGILGFEKTHDILLKATKAFSKFDNTKQ